MRLKHKKYILENIDRKTIKEISCDLNLKEKKIKKFLEYQKDRGKQIAPDSPTTEIPISKKPILLSIILIMTLGFAVYGNSLNNGFIWDDEFLIEENKYLKDWSYLPLIFSKDVRVGEGEQNAFYRPLQMTTYMVDHSIWKSNPQGYHLTNIVLHIAAALALFWLIHVIFGSNFLALLTGIFFVTHPVHTEAVTYISGRTDLLALLFMLLCFVFYLKSLSSGRARMYFLMILSYPLALLSRESSLILPVLFLLYHYSFKKKIRVKEFASITSIAVIYVLLRVTVLKVALTGGPQTTTLWQRLPGFFVAVTNYVRLLFLPFNLHMEYGNELYHWGDLKAMTGVVLWFALIIYAFRNKRDNRLVFFSIALFIVALLPVSNLYPINAYMAEHWLYLPSIGFFLIAAQAVHSLYKVNNFRVLSVIFVLCLTIFYSYLTIRQNIFWGDPISFYERTLEYAPDSPRVQNNLGSAYNEINRNEEAIALYKKAITIKPDYPEARYNLGNAYKDMNRLEEAIASYQRATKVRPDYVQAYYNLGNAYKVLDKWEEAISSYKRAIEIKVDHERAYNNLGLVYADINKKDKAVTAYKKAIEIKADYADAYNNLGIAYADMNRNEEAVSSYKRAIELNPDYAKAYNNIGLVYARTNREEKAVAAYKKAISIKPDYAKAHNNLGYVYAVINKSDEAVASFKKAIAIKPDYAKAYDNLSVIYFQRKQYQLSVEYFDKAKKLGLINPVLLEALKPYRH